MISLILNIYIQSLGYLNNGSKKLALMPILLLVNIIFGARKFA